MPDDKRAHDIYNEILKAVEICMKSDTTTYTHELNKVGNTLFGKSWRGALPRDKSPKMKNGDYAILNLDKSTENGSHWVAVYKNKNKKIIYDSFGRKSKTILPILSKSGGVLVDTDYDQDQKDTQLNCGQRSIAFLLLVKIWGPKLAMLI